MKVAYIEWTDAKMAHDTWSLADIKEERLCGFVSAGVLVHETPEFVVIAQDWDGAKSDGRSIEWIPRTGITLLKMLDMETR